MVGPAGDINGDGFGDLVVGPSAPGVVYVTWASGAMHVGLSSISLSGYYPVYGARDLNGDTVPDVLVQDGPSPSTTNVYLQVPGPGSSMLASPAETLGDGSPSARASRVRRVEPVAPSRLASISLPDAATPSACSPLVASCVL
jgi:hypothetical protein